MRVQRVRVMVGWPQRLFLDSLCTGLSLQEDIAVVAETIGGRGTSPLARESRPDVAVVDFYLWNDKRIGLKRTFKAIGTRSVVIVPGDNRAAPPAAELLEGASELVVVDEPIGALIEAVHAAARSVVSESELATTMDRPPDNPVSVLTPQEINVLRLLAEGLTTKEISSKLHIAGRTVENHRSRVARKLDVHSTAGLIRYAIRNGIVPP